MSTSTTGSGSNYDEALLKEGGVPALLVGAKQEILDLFVDAVRDAFPGGYRVARPLVIDTLPAFITSLALALSPHSSRQVATEGSTAAMTHGEERAVLTGYTLDDLIHEYQVLRKIIFDTLLARTALSPQAVGVINDSIDLAIREATQTFVHAYDELRGRVAATLTHDLRGPLGAAYNYVQLLRSAGGSEEARERFCSGAMRNLGRVRQMIDDLLDHSRASTGESLQLRFEPLELRGLIDEVVSDLRATHGDRYVLESPGAIDGVWSPDALKRAVFNLAENATKYGDPDSRVTITLAQIDGSVSISVHNRGAPIPAEERRWLFQAFRRGSSDRASMKPGWGLGLTAVKEIAEAHGGSIMVESTAEEGTTFTLHVFRDAREFASGRQPGR